MELKIKSNDFAACLADVIRAVNNKNPLPILTNVLLKVQDGRLSLTGSDGEVSITSSFPVDTNESVSFVIQPKAFNDVFKNLSQQEVTIEVEDNLQVNVKYHRGKFSVIGGDAHEFPSFVFGEDKGNMVTIGSATLKNAISFASISMDENDLRPIMKGICFDAKDNLVLAATNAKMLSKTVLKKAAVTGGPFRFVLPDKAVKVIKNILPKEADIAIRCSERAAWLSYESEGRCMSLFTTLVEGRFPNYDVVIPKNNNNVLTIDRQSTLGILNRIAAFTNELTQQIRLQVNEPELEGSTVTFSAQDIDFSHDASETESCSYSGTPMSLGFRLEYVTDALKSLQGENADFLFSEPSRAALIVPTVQEEDIENTILVMPIALK